jgi:sialic acid synthase
MSTVEIAPGHLIGEDKPTFIIGEIGINHNGRLDLAKQLIDLGKESGCNCVKFQKRTVNRILTKEGLQRPYDNSRSFGKTYGEHKRFLEFSNNQFRELKDYADSIGVLFTASGWDEESIDFLDEIGVPFFKMASADITNFPLLEHTAKKGKPMIISTGMSNMETVKKAYNLVSTYNDKIIILQCTSTYPTSPHEINLNVIKTYKKQFPDAVIGYSGHENGISISLAAVVMGASVVERHYTLDRSMKGGDHAASLEKEGLRRLIRDIREFEIAKGSYEKRMQESEHKCFEKLSKSVVSVKSIPKDTILTRDMLTTKGPGKGISPMKLNSLIGLKVNKDIEEDCVIYEQDICWEE